MGRVRQERPAEVFAKACAKVGLPGVRTYDLRHSIATAYLRAGADLADVQDLLGHTTPRMTRRYAPFHAAKLRAAGDRLMPRESVTPPEAEHG